jgi:hypothetical protein
MEPQMEQHTVLVQIHPDTILIDLARALATGGFSIVWRPQPGDTGGGLVIRHSSGDR